MEVLIVAAVALACPIGMGVMMWFMARGMMGGKKEEPAGSGSEQPSLNDLKDEHDRLGAEIARAQGAGDEGSRSLVSGRSG